MNTDILRYVNLARKIKMKSEAGQINWSPASFLSTYEASMGSQGLIAIQMTSPKLNTQMPSYNLAFKNERGETFYTLRDKEVKNVPDIRTLLEGIYKSARLMQSRARDGQTLSNMESFIDTL